MNTHYISKFIFYISIGVLQVLTLSLNAQVIDTNSIRADSSSIDTTGITAIETLEERFQKVNPLYLSNLNTVILYDEINKLDTLFDRKQVSLDSFSTDQSLDTLLKYNEEISASLTRLKSLQQTITGYRDNLQSIKKKMTLLKNDSAINREISDNLSLSNKGNALKVQIQETDLRVRSKLDSLNLLLNYSGRTLRKGTETQNYLSERINNARALNENQESKYIWAAPKHITGKNLITTFKANNQSRGALANVFSSHFSKLFLLVLISAGFFYWQYWNNKNLSKWEKKNKFNKISSNELFERSSNKNLIVAVYAVIFLFTLFPLFLPQLSTLSIQLVQLIVMLNFLLVSKIELQAKRMHWWLTVVLFYVFVLLVNNFLNNGFFIRLIALTFNIITIFFGYNLRNQSRKENPIVKISGLLFIIFIAFNVGAIVMNILGKVVFSKTLSIAGIVSLVQYVCLIGFKRIIKDAFALQFLVSEKAGGFFKSIQKHRAQITLRKVLNLIAVIVWLTVLAINLGFIHYVLRILKIFLSESHPIGDFSFTWGNVFLFIIIIGISNWFQKHLPLFFSSSTSKTDDQETDNKGSVIALLRLLIIVGGFLIGIGALGISMDKLTIIIGALSVGIGLGLQNIFNNFVSGVILIFDKPFRVGDFVELADKKGRVQDIGIRSSTLLTQEGAEVIIPNGDFLSGRLVNWTLSKSYSQSSITVSVNSDSDMAKVFQLIEEEAKNLPYVKKEMPVEILYSKVSTGAIELKINCYITNIYNDQLFKSSLLQVLFDRFKKEQIDITSVV